MVGLGMQPYDIQSMLKEGHKHLSGLDKVVLKNTNACKQLSQVTHTSLGPNGTIFRFRYGKTIHCFLRGVMMLPLPIFGIISNAIYTIDSCILRKMLKIFSAK